jgi:hypothetical protein
MIVKDFYAEDYDENTGCDCKLQQEMAACLPWPLQINLAYLEQVSSKVGEMKSYPLLIAALMMLAAGCESQKCGVEVEARFDNFSMGSLAEAGRPAPAVIGVERTASRS